MTSLRQEAGFRLPKRGIIPIVAFDSGPCRWRLDSHLDKSKEGIWHDYLVGQIHHRRGILSVDLAWGGTYGTEVQFMAFVPSLPFTALGFFRTSHVFDTSYNRNAQALAGHEAVLEPVGG